MYIIKCENFDGSSELDIADHCLLQNVEQCVENKIMLPYQT